MSSKIFIGVLRILASSPNIESNIISLAPLIFFKELASLFRSIDTDGSGALTMPEVVLFLKSITDDISEDNIEKIFAALDDSGDKAVDFQEFKVDALSRIL